MNHVVGSIQREYNKLFQEDNDDHDDMELENRTKKLKNKFNNDIKTEYAQYEEKVDDLSYFEITTYFSSQTSLLWLWYNLRASSAICWIRLEIL